MIRQDVLDQATHEAAGALFPHYSRRQITPGVLEALRGELAVHVRDSLALQGIEGPFKLELHAGAGTVHVTATPLERPEERTARQALEAAERQASAERARAERIAADQARNAAHPGRAKVQGSDAEPFVSIPGMLADLQHWQTPHDLWNEEAVGFQRALEDVRRYLLARARQR